MEHQAVPLEVLEETESQLLAKKDEAAQLRARADEIDRMADANLAFLRNLMARAVPVPAPAALFRPTPVALPQQERIAADTGRSAVLFTVDDAAADGDDGEDEDEGDGANSPMAPGALRSIILTTVRQSPLLTRRDLTARVKAHPGVTSSTKSISNTIRDMATKGILTDLDGLYVAAEDENVAS